MKGSDFVFNIGDKIIYGFEGVFVVSEYTDSPLDKNDKRVFYVLRPVNGSTGNKIVTPADGSSVPVRAVMGSDEAAALLKMIPEISEVAVLNERLRREEYRKVMTRGRSEDFVSIIKTVRRRRIEFMAQKRRLSETDTDFESRAKNCLLTELSISLGITYAEADKLVAEKLAI